jgi:asparagine synthase (glutamine-hydrolysing)
MGRRPLFFAELGTTLVIASAVGGVLEHPLSSKDLNLPSIAEAMAGYVGSGSTTCYRCVSRLHAGRTLIREGKSRLRTELNWEAPTFHSGNSLSFDDAAEQLREMLSAAVAERLSHVGSSTVWMSGGRDSTAVFAAGMDVIRRRSLATDLRPISISYPEGDSGREDETIESVAAHWKVPVKWLSISDIPLLDLPLEHAACRDEPLAHVFEGAYRTLAAATESMGSHVALDGVGGDQLFLRSNVQLADLFRTGNWLALARDWKAAGLGNSGFVTFFQLAVQPVLPTSMLLGARRLRHGRPLGAWLRRRLPPWISEDFTRQHELEEYDRVLAPRRRGETVGSTESRWYFTDPFFPCVFRLGADCALEHGVELRSPLYDRRIIELAATRPASDHPVGMEGKRLLRHAMRDLLPSAVLAPREARTGTPQDYTGNALRDFLSVPFNERFPSSALENLGLIDVTALERARLKFLRMGSFDLRLPLLLTLHTEFWLRARGIGVRAAETFAGNGGLSIVANDDAASGLVASNSPEENTPLFI